MTKPLNQLFPGQSARIVALEGNDNARLRDLGFAEGGRVTCLFPSAFGDPHAYRVRDTVVALRQKDARRVLCDGGDV